jgi:hypothetical protein
MGSHEAGQKPKKLDRRNPSRSTNHIKAAQTETWQPDIEFVSKTTKHKSRLIIMTAESMVAVVAVAVAVMLFSP